MASRNKNKALDSNIIINLFEIHNGTAPDYYHQDKDFLLSVYHLYDLIPNSDFNFYITPAVLSEIKDGVEKYGHDEEIFQFIADMGIELAVVPDELQTACNKIKQTYLGKNKEANYLGKAFSMENASDAQIMAEATVLGLDVITNNTRHFIGEHKGQSSIKDRILRINNALGFSQGVPNTSYQFLKKKVPELFDRHGNISRNPTSLALAPLDAPKQKKQHKNKYAHFSKSSKDEADLPADIPETELDTPTSYHPEDYPTEYHSFGKPLFQDYDNFCDDLYDEPTN